MKKKLEDSWRDLLKNPKEWTDHRQAKLEGSVRAFFIETLVLVNNCMATYDHVSHSFQVNKKFPDFKRKDNTAALWLNSAPKWVLFDIEGIEFGGSDQLKPAKENKGWSVGFLLHADICNSLFLFLKYCIRMLCNEEILPT